MQHKSHEDRKTTDELAQVRTRLKVQLNLQSAQRIGCQLAQPAAELATTTTIDARRLPRHQRPSVAVSVFNNVSGDTDLGCTSPLDSATAQCNQKRNLNEGLEWNREGAVL